MTEPLHVDGKYIKDSNNWVVKLRGVNLGFTFGDIGGAGYWMGEQGWNVTRASTELDVIKSWGANLVRIHEVYRNWKDNVIDPVSGLTHRVVVRALAEMCDAKGLYLMIDGYGLVGFGEVGCQQDPLPWPPYSLRDDVIGEPQDWIDIWVSITNALKDLPNVMFEPHNEPQPPAAEWFPNLQDCVDAMRATGYTGLLFYQYEYGTWVNLDFPFTDHGDLRNWVDDYPITDATGNLVISTHHYWDMYGCGVWSVSHGAPPDVVPTAYADIYSALVYEGLSWCLDTWEMPVFVGECGVPNVAGAPEAWASQLQAYNDLGISYAAFWFRAGYTYPLITGDGDPQPNQYGTILKTYLLAETYLTDYRVDLASMPRRVAPSLRRYTYAGRRITF